MTQAIPALGGPRVKLRAAAAALEVPVRLAVLTLLALSVYYFIGYDQAAASVFGSDTHVHEFVDDARHVLGFPCH
ncbi:CbtB-domain containing protein [Mycolicibacterium sp.]|jgi:hypothetical protein|uniref:CbtB domain-containing protein n=1 Tax=Mycolicibacterium sp. TaxID=2320850 RepID=UPI0028AE85EE|nr:CbtB-domain containing protein [Mycolicibacterium sp.]